MKICAKCEEKINPTKPDPCIGKYLEGIAHACCGHGNDISAYCVGWDNCYPNEGNAKENKLTRNGFDFRGRRALEYMESVK